MTLGQTVILEARIRMQNVMVPVNLTRTVVMDTDASASSVVNYIFLVNLIPYAVLFCTIELLP